MNRKILHTVLTVGAIVAGISIATPAQANDNYCRDFNQEIMINGNYEMAYGRACLQPNGTWKIVSKASRNHDDYQTSHHVIKKRYSYTSPFRIAFYSGHGHHYYGHGYHHKKRRQGKHYYNNHHGKKHHVKRHGGHKKHH